MNIPDIFTKDGPISKIYDDSLSPAAKQIGEISADVIKALRLFTAPIQLIATYQDRLTKYLNKVVESIDEKNQIPPAPSLSGPILEKIKYLDETNYLTNCYLSLLQKASDIQTVHIAHPSFFSIIEQLSSDEVRMLEFLKENNIMLSYMRTATVRTDWGHNPRKAQNEIQEENTPFNLLDIPDHLHLYYSHLMALNLISYDEIDREHKKDIFGHTYALLSNKIVSTRKLTEFGRLFVVACTDKVL